VDNASAWRSPAQIELTAIQQQLGVTFVYVTHDQEEALAMSDRLAVFNHGRIDQVGTPAEVYESPATRFVAGFVGVSNLIGGALVRPEKIRIADAGATVDPGCAFADGRIREVVYLGIHTRYLVETGDALVTVVEQNRDATSGDVHASRGRAVRLVWARAVARAVAEGP
jgi:putative spermidine/putrescine transport system ATP-binding protein